MSWEEAGDGCGEFLWCFLGDVVACAGDAEVAVGAGEVVAVVAGDGSSDAVGSGFDDDGGDGDGWLGGDEVFECLVLGVAVCEEVAVSVGVDDDVGEVGVVEAGCCGGEGCCCAFPGG